MQSLKYGIAAAAVFCAAALSAHAVEWALTVEKDGATGVEETSGFSRGVLTSVARRLLGKLSVSSPLKGYRVLLGAAAEGDMTIFTAKTQKLGFNISIR